MIGWGREICGDLLAAERREWLCTNGIGGFASGTVAGLLTRRYHGLLVAALRPPLGRTLLVARVDETAAQDDLVRPLAANRWAGGAIDPRGYREIQSFALDGTTRCGSTRSAPRSSRSASGWSRAPTRRMFATASSARRGRSRSS